MDSETKNGNAKEPDAEAISSMWPDDINESVKQFDIEKPTANKDILEEVVIIEDPKIVDFNRLIELTNYTEKGSSQLAHLVKCWENKQANAVQQLRKELEKKPEQRCFEETYESNDGVQHERVEIESECDSGNVMYWKNRAMRLEKLLQESIGHMERQSSPVEEFLRIFERADSFLHFVLQNAPVAIGHQDRELRYRFIYNHFPSLSKEDIIGKTDVEIFTGAGVKEIQDFKREVLEIGLPAKREITYDTGIFGTKTFLMYVEPVFSKSGETIGVNYIGMDVTDQVIKRERIMAKLREEIALQNAKDTIGNPVRTSEMEKDRSCVDSDMTKSC